MLRSRSKPGDTPRQPSRFQENTPHIQAQLTLAGKGRRCRMRFSKLLLIVVVLILVFAGYMRSNIGILEQSPEVFSQITEFEASVRDIGEDVVRQASEEEQQHNSSSSSNWRYPLVDRAILEKLDRMDAFFARDYYSLRSSRAKPAPRAQWPPLVTRIPERPSSRFALSPNPQMMKDTTVPDLDICDSVKHPRSCRFLFPLRIAEQESKARIHLAQIVQLAKELNRTVVLPNVGKSRIGACYKWNFGTYYDMASLSYTPDDSESYLTLEDFRAWLDGRGQHRPISSQLVSVASSLPAHLSVRNDKVLSNEDVVVHAYEEYGAWKDDLPGCFSTRFPRLDLETFPVFMSTQPAGTREGNDVLIGDSIVDAFSAMSSQGSGVDHATQRPASSDLYGSADPQVLVIDWDLRQPVFPPALDQEPLEYSQGMKTLANEHTPSNPYLVVQWRMETVDPEVLEDCAHALVDVLSRLLHDEALAANITTVWFASDYPYPIARRTKSQPRPALVAKSGTFRDFEIRHENAVEVLRNAFDEGNELERWKLTDLAEAMETNGKDSQLMQDSGVLGILDKMISIDAVLFVSGSSRCSRRSSFTRQVVDARMERNRGQPLYIGNIVDTFG